MYSSPAPAPCLCYPPTQAPLCYSPDCLWNLYYILDFAHSLSAWVCLLDFDYCCIRNKDCCGLMPLLCFHFQLSSSASVCHAYETGDKVCRGSCFRQISSVHNLKIRKEKCKLMTAMTAHSKRWICPRTTVINEGLPSFQLETNVCKLKEIEAWTL